MSFADNRFHSSTGLGASLPGSSDRGFGLVMAGAWAVLALAPLRHAHSIRFWPSVGALVFLGFAMFRPTALSYPHRLWMRFGNTLGRVTEPIFLALLFFLIFTPLAWLMRGLGRRPLSLRFDRQARTYWVDAPAFSEPYSETMRRQF